MDVVSETLIAGAEGAEDRSLVCQTRELVERVKWFRAASLDIEVAAAGAGLPLSDALWAAAVIAAL